MCRSLEPLIDAAAAREEVRHDDDEQDDPKAGYKRPPKATQFQKGRSGNPNGRPKGAKSLYDLMLEDGRQRVRVKGPYGTKMITS